MIIRRQWVGSARVLQVLNLIGPEGPIAPGGTPGRKPGEEHQAGNPREGRKYQAHRPHSTTAPQAPQHHRPHSHSVLTASLLSHHPSHCLSPFNFHIKHSKHKRKTTRN